MNRSASLMVIFPAMACLSALALAIAVPVLMRSPEVVIATILDQRTVSTGDETQKKLQVDYSIAHRVLTSLDRPGGWPGSDYLASDVVPVGWKGPVSVGDKMTVTRGDGERLELEISGVHPFESPLRNVSNTGDASQLVMLVAKVIGKPDAPTLRMFLEAETPAPFVIEADGAQSL
ncbi:MAG: hypothetical protein ACR2PG_13685 [Hyphomicrobiaceae bacterium]